MGCGTFGVTQVMIGLHRVGIVGLRQVLTEVEDADLASRHDTLAYMLNELAGDNYIPEQQLDDYRKALWREVLRQQGEDFSDFYSEVDVTIHGDPNESRDLFVEQLHSIFSDFELRPIFSFSGEIDDGLYPMLAAGDHIIVRGLLSRQDTRLAVRKSFSGW